MTTPDRAFTTPFSFLYSPALAGALIFTRMDKFASSLGKPQPLGGFGVTQRTERSC